MSELPFELIDREACGPVETVDLELEQTGPGEVEGTATVYRRDTESGEIRFLIDGEPVPESPLEIPASPLFRTRTGTWRGIINQELSVSATPGIGTFEVEFGELTRELSLLGELPESLVAVDESPNGDGEAGVDGDSNLTIVTGRNTDMWVDVNGFTSIYAPDALTDPGGTATVRVPPIEEFPGFDHEAGYDFLRAGIIVRNSIPNDGDDSGYVHLFYSPTGDPDVRLQADFTGDGFSTYNDPDAFGGDPFPIEPPLWLGLERDGGTFTSSVAVDENGSPGTWQEHRTVELPNVTPVQDVGVYAAHNNEQRITVTFDAFSVNDGGEGL